MTILLLLIVAMVVAAVLSLFIITFHLSIVPILATGPPAVC